MKTIDYKFGLRAVMGAVVITFVVMFGACSEDAPQPAPEEPEAPAGGESPLQRSADIELTAEEAQIVDATIATAFKLFKAKSNRERCMTEPQDNVVFSPLSISWLMSMLANGAAGETQAQILDGLGYKKHSMGAVNGFFEKIAPMLNAIDPTAEFKSARSVWLNAIPERCVRESFRDVISKCYDAPVKTVESFLDPRSCALVNDWFAEQTNGMITDLISPVEAGSAAFLMADALYFKGQWTWPFDPSRTVDYTFNNEDGSKSTVQMMEGPDMQYITWIDESFSAIRMSFGNEAFMMIIVIPQEGIGIEECVAAVCEDPARMRKIARATAGSSSHILHMPKFDLSYGTTFSDVLVNDLGISNVFSMEKADLSQFVTNDYTGGNPFVSGCCQKTRISIDEEKAESASGSFILPHEGISELPYEVFVDRPFIFLISERSTGLPLFMGRVTKL